MENEDRQPPERSRPPMATLVTVAIVVVLLIALGLYFMGRDDTPEPPPATEAASSTAPAEPDPAPAPEREAEPEVASAPASEPEEPLPPLDESDEAARDSAGEIVNDELVSLLVEDDLIRKLVRAVDSADEGRVVHEYRPVLSPRPPLVVERMGEAAADADQQYRMTNENYQRYDRYVELLTSTDAATLASWYQRFLPLMEEAFVEHGTDKGSFHDVVMNTVDELLDAPPADPKAVLVRPKVFYEFQDEELENMPDTHKLMQRIGPEHSERVREVLSSLRGELQRMAP